MHKLTLKDYLEERKPPEVKLHLGCGGVRWRDFINVDLHPHDPSVERQFPEWLRGRCLCRHHSLGLPDSSIDEIFTSHTIDHFTRWVAIDMLKDWHRMLKRKRDAGY